MEGGKGGCQSRGGKGEGMGQRVGAWGPLGQPRRVDCLAGVELCVCRVGAWKQGASSQRGTACLRYGATEAGRRPCLKGSATGGTTASS